MFVLFSMTRFKVFARDARIFVDAAMQPTHKNSVFEVAMRPNLPFLKCFRLQRHLWYQLFIRHLSANISLAIAACTLS